MFVKEDKTSQRDLTHDKEENFITQIRWNSFFACLKFSSSINNFRWMSKTMNEGNERK